MKLSLPPRLFFSDSNIVLLEFWLHARILLTIRFVCADIRSSRVYVSPRLGGNILHDSRAIGHLQVLGLWDETAVPSAACVSLRDVSHH